MAQLAPGTSSSFSPASALPRTASPPRATTFNAPAPTTGSSGVSNRNASNAHLPMPPTIGDGSISGTTSNGGIGQNSASVAGPSVPKKPVNMPSTSKRSLVVNACQRGNPLLKLISNVSWEYGDIIPDYVLGANTCCLFLSLRYHRLHPEYLHSRIEKMRGMYLGRVLLVLCDINEHQEPIREITKVCLINEMTVMVAWTNDEAALYLSTYKLFEHRPPDLLKERVNQDYASQLQNVLTGVRGVNKTDVMTLGTNFGSFKSLANATPEQLSLCPGLGDIKVRRLHDAFSLPFKVTPSSRAKTRARAEEKIKEREREKAQGKGGKGKKVKEVGPGQLTLLEMGNGGNVVPVSRDGDGGEVMDLDADEDENEEEEQLPDPAITNQPKVVNPNKNKEREPSPEWPEELPSDDDDDDEDVIGDGAAVAEAVDQGEATTVKAWKDPLASDSEEEG